MGNVRSVDQGQAKEGQPPSRQTLKFQKIFERLSLCQKHQRSSNVDDIVDNNNGGEQQRKQRAALPARQRHQGLQAVAGRLVESGRVRAKSFGSLDRHGGLRQVRHLRAGTMLQRGRCAELYWQLECFSISKLDFFFSNSVLSLLLCQKCFLSFYNDLRTQDSLTFNFVLYRIFFQLKFNLTRHIPVLPFQQQQQHPR